MSAATFNVTILLVTAALFVLYWTLFRAHFRKQFKKPNDIFTHVPLPHLQKSYIKKTVYGEIRFRQFTMSLNNNNKNNNNNTIWIIFISGHGDSLDIYDTLINELYEKLLLNPPKTNGYNKINMITYDRIGYGMSSSFNSVNGNNLCISPPLFSSITSNDRAVELLSFLMNVEVNNYKFNLFKDELILIGHSYGGLIAQSFLNVLSNDLNIYYPDISSLNLSKSINIKLLLMDSSWIDIDIVIGKFKVNKIECYKDYFMTICGFQAPNMFYKYPSFNYLKEINPNYENEITNNIQICLYFRAYGDQLISQWNESLGFWHSMQYFGDNINQWTEKINNLKEMHNINVKIYNLYSVSMNTTNEMSKEIGEINKNWCLFHGNLSSQIDNKYLIKNECIDDCHHYIHLEKPQLVLDRVLELINQCQMKVN